MLKNAEMSRVFPPDRYLAKAKSVRTGKWEIGSLIHFPDGRYEIGNVCDNPPDGDPIWKKSIVTHEVHPETICQCIGRRDKDGKLIFEFDFLECTYIGFNQEVEKDVCLVYWDLERCGWALESTTGCSMNFGDDFISIKNLGSAFDNGQLWSDNIRCCTRLESGNTVVMKVF